MLMINHPSVIEPGRYRHFKGNEYQVICTATHTESGEIMVVYQALYGDEKIWVRPLYMWNETVDRGDYHGPRFIKIED